MTKEYNIVYKTTNLYNGKFYVGVHSTNKLEDGYIGCGIRRSSDARRVAKRSRFYNLGDAVVKYGYASFRREVIYFCTSKEEASKRIKKYQDKLVAIHSKEYVLYSVVEDRVYFTKNLAKFCRDRNIKDYSLRSVVEGKSRVTSDGWWGCHKRDWTGAPKIKEQSKYRTGRSGVLYKEGKSVRFSNLREAAKLINSDASSICKLIKGKLNSVKGWILVS